MSEARIEHEFEDDGFRLRVQHTERGWSVYWKVAASISDTWRELQLSGAHRALAAEIARLRGLVPPGGEEEK